MKDLISQLKKFWWLILISILLDFFWIEAYVYPTLTFDLSKGLDPMVWIRIFLKRIPFFIGFYFLLILPNRDKLLKNGTTDPNY